MDKNFILKVEEFLPDNSAVYQLPYMAFPEVPPLYHLSTYGLATPFLHSSSLRWSYGGMKGSDGDLFYRYLSQESLEKQIEVIEWLGFAGIYIDRRGFSDNAEKIVSDLTVMLDRPPSLERTDGEIVFFQLNPDRTQNIDGLQADQIMEKAGYFVDHLGIRYDAELDEGIDFSRVDFPIFVRDIHGLSGHEPLGRWSDANLSPSVRIDFREPLPNQFSMVLSGYPFGPNTDQELKVRIGSQIHKFRMGGGPFEFKRAIDLGNERITQIEFIPPQPTSPKQLGISADNRKLGIWFSRLSFEK
jgi:phosphoglycerol transferase